MSFIAFIQWGVEGLRFLNSQLARSFGKLVNEPLHPRGFFVVTPVRAFPQERRRLALLCVPACACEA